MGGHIIHSFLTQMLLTPNSFDFEVAYFVFRHMQILLGYGPRSLPLLLVDDNVNNAGTVFDPFDPLR